MGPNWDENAEITVQLKEGLEQIMAQDQIEQSFKKGQNANQNTTERNPPNIVMEKLQQDKMELIAR